MASKLRRFKLFCLAAGITVLAAWRLASVDAAQPAAVPEGKIDAHALARLIDTEVQRRLDADGVKPSPRADDAEFLRRVYLDLIGVIPPPEKVTAFLGNTDPDKRSKVIDELLANPRFGRYLAETWSGLLVPRQANNRRLDHKPLQDWLADGFNSGKPLDKLVYDLITASGAQDQNGAATYFIYNPTADKITDSVTHMFLGVRLQCAQCHNHPFVDIKQKDYWGMAAFFTKVRLSGNPNKAAKKGTAISVVEAGGPAKGKKNLPASAKIVPAKFLKGEEPKLAPQQPARPVLARWMTAPANPYFAKAMVNRAWYQCFGRGIVNPVDDMHEGNAPSHPELLALMTQQLKDNGFDLKFLYRAICNSEAYQRTSRPDANNKDDGELYSHAAVRALSPEQLYDSLVAVVGGQAGARPGKADKKAQQGRKGPGGPREAFLNFFRVDEGANPLEYQAGIPQALRLMNSPQTSGNGLLPRIMNQGKSPADVIERLYLAVLSRQPTSQESQRMAEYVSRQETPRAGYSDVLWVLLNSSEFTLNH